MKERTFPKLIIFQASLPLLNSEASRAWKDPIVAFPETDTAVTFCDRSEFRDLDAEFKGAAVAVALIDLEVLGMG